MNNNLFISFSATKKFPECDYNLKMIVREAIIATLEYEDLIFGAEVSVRGEYPAWEYKENSLLRDTMCRVYRDLYGKDAEVITIHAGLECGIFSAKMPDLDCVSIGPDNFDIHTTEERLSLTSFERVFKYILEVLKNIK